MVWEGWIFWGKNTGKRQRSNLIIVVHRGFSAMMGIPLSRQNTCPVRGIFLGGDKRSPWGVRARDSKVGMSRRALSVSIRREA